MTHSRHDESPIGLQRIRYRVRQFTNGLAARVDAAETDAIKKVLPPAGLALFRRMPTDAKRHSLNVYNTLQSSGRADPDLAAAALLHDVGKVAADEAGARINLWLRGPLVLLETLAEARLYGLASANPAHGWRYALHVHIEHPAIGAAWAANAGCSDTTCWLIAQHQNKNAQTQETRLLELLHALQWADNMN